MLKKLYQKIAGKNIGLKERTFRMFLFVGVIVSVLAMIKEMAVAEDANFFFMLLVFLPVMGGIFLITYRFRKIELAAMIIALLEIFVLLPGMFLFKGGIEGGAMIWMTMGILYVFVMFSGRRLWFFLGLAVAVDCIVYAVAYYYPESVAALASRRIVYMDSLTTVVLVGVTAGLVLRLQVRIYEIERQESLKQKKELEKISDSKNEFFANMSHEIRTPINSIIGLNELVLRQELPKEVREYSENIQVATKMLLNLVNDVLDLSQLEIKRMEMVPVEYGTVALFEELLQMIRISAEEKKLELIADVDKNLPKIMWGDEKRLKQVVLNLLTNAVKYTKKGSVTLSVHGEAVDEREIKLRISVTDTGVGIRKEELEYIYDSFRRTDEDYTRRVEGSGLGLAITKQLLELMDGEITVDSIYRKGSVFTVSLRQRVIDWTPVGDINFMEQVNEGHHEYQTSFEAPEARVMIVDDNEVNSMVIARLLDLTKVQVDVAKSGSECLVKTKEKYYHVILMDYLMPGMNGVETFREIRKQQNGLCRDSAVIILTANLLSSARQLCEEHGFDGYLEKPIQGARLEAEILNLLPEEIVEYRRSSREDGETAIHRIAGRKRKKVRVTSDCVCDLPESLREKYEIELMYLYIRTDKGRFADTREIDSDNLSQYLSATTSMAYADSVSVEEYEEFFAEALTQAEEIVHISMAKNAGKSYGIAVTAAKGFDHVHVIDAGHISGGEGLLAVYAGKLAMDGCSCAEICAEVERIKERVESRYLMPNCRIFYQHGYTNAVVMKLCELFQLHPSLAMRQSRLVIVGVRTGNLEHAWRRYIRHHLWRKWRIDPAIIYITHVGCSVKQQELIRNEVLRCIPFEKVIFQKASFSNACNSGIGTFGFAYYLKVPKGSES